MALPDFFKNEVGTPKVWKASGGDYAMTFAGITNGNGRQGAKGDLGANRAAVWAARLVAAVASAATAGNTIDIYWADSTSATAGTDNPAGTSGTDAAFNTTPSEYTPQLTFIGSLVLSNNAGTGVQTSPFLKFIPPTRYGMPVIVNSSGQTLHGTEANFSLTLIPIEEAIEDTV